MTGRHALTIAGSDSSAGAGLQADLKTFAAYKVYGTSVVTAVTAQHTAGVSAVMPLPADMVTAQIEAVAGDIRLHATKIGMLATAAIVEAVAAAIERRHLPLVVLDPVLAASSGAPLLDADAVRILCARLLPLTYVVTPNIPEAEALSGCRVAADGDRRRAAERLHEMGAAAVVITGGHAAPLPSGDDVVDLLFDGETFVELRTPRVDIPPVHGTGCAFSAALAAGLACGRPLAEAAKEAQAFVAGAMAHRIEVGRGAHVLNHFWKMRPGRRPGSTDDVLDSGARRPGGPT